MKSTIKFPGSRFLTGWTLWTILVFPLSYALSFIPFYLVEDGIFGYGETELGTPLSNTLSFMAAGIILGLGIGLLQKRLLEKFFKVSWYWMYAAMLGFVINELITGLFLWPVGTVRGQLIFLDGDLFAEALIYTAAGLIIGLLQWRVLKKAFKRSAFWILASGLGWGICFFTLCSWNFFPSLAHSILAIALFGLVASILYGLITGTVILWIMKSKKT